MKLSTSEVQQSFGHLPPVLSVQQAAAAIGVPIKTVYEWSSQGRLANCSRRRGKRLLVFRDKFIMEIFNGPEWNG